MSHLYLCFYSKKKTNNNSAIIRKSKSQQRKKVLLRNTKLLLKARDVYIKTTVLDEEKLKRCDEEDFPMTTRTQKRANTNTNGKPLRSVGMCSDLPLRSPRQTWPLFPPRMMMMLSSSYDYERERSLL